jgi:alkylhydroperoxidase family enzyme
MGWSDEQLGTLHQPNESFSARERVALKFADLMTLDPHGITDELFAELRLHFQEGEIVELASVIGIYNYFNRFNEALKMESAE